MPSILDLLGMAGGGVGASPFSGILDLFGRETAGPSLPGMAPPAHQASSNDPSPSMLDPRAMMQFSQGMMNAGAPTTTPTDLGAAMGQGMNNMQPQSRLRLPGLPKLTLGGR